MDSLLLSYFVILVIATGALLVRSRGTPGNRGPSFFTRLRHLTKNWLRRFAG